MEWESVIFVKTAEILSSCYVDSLATKPSTPQHIVINLDILKQHEITPE